MKRIVSTRKASYIIVLCLLTVFFTGCNKGYNPGDFYDVPIYDENEVREDILTDEDMTTAAVILESNLDQEKLDEITDESREERFFGVNGRRAFYFPKNHPVDRDSLQQFHVLGLLDKTFYYSYTTRSEDRGFFIKAVARYNYETRIYKLLYERKVKVQNNAYTDFYSQLLTDQGDNLLRICIYEDGNLIMLDNFGKLEFSFTNESGGQNMGDLIRKVFDVGGENYDVEILDVISDGRYGFYIPVTVIKENYMDDSDSDITTQSYLFVYTYLTVDTGIQMLYRDNLNREKQEEEFRKLATAGGLRVTELDWENVLSKYPDQWGPFYLGTLKGGEVINEGYAMQWITEGERIFTSVEGLPATHPDAKSVKLLESVRTGERLKDIFIFRRDSMSLCDLMGEVKNQVTTTKKLERKYTYEVYFTGKDENGNDTMEFEERPASDSVNANWWKKVVLKEGAFINEYVVKMQDMGVSMAISPVERDRSYQMAFVVENKCIMETNKKNDNSDILEFPLDNKETELDIRLLNTIDGCTYVMASDTQEKKIFFKAFGENSGLRQRPVVIYTSDLASKYRKGAGDEKLFDEMKEIGNRDDKATKFDFSGVDVQDNPSVYTEESVIVMGGPKKESFLFTSFQNGMQLYQPGRQQGNKNASTPGTLWRISNWPIYQAWPVSATEVTAIGFDKETAVYESMDIAMARVYSFKIDEIVKDRESVEIPLKEEPQESAGQ